MNRQALNSCRARRACFIWTWLLLAGLSLALASCGSSSFKPVPSAGPVKESVPVSAVTPAADASPPAASPTPLPPTTTPTPTPIATPLPSPSTTSAPTDPLPSPTHDLAQVTAATKASLPVVNIPSFAADIQPIFIERCIKCHSGNKPPRGLRLDSYEHVIAGGTYRPVVMPGNPAESEIIRRLKGIAIPRMPFDGPPFLPDEKIGLIEAWIAAGALQN